MLTVSVKMRPLSTIFLVVILNVLTGEVSGNQQSTAAGWPACGNTGIEYLYVDGLRSFRNSQDFCNSLGGATLATPVNAEHYECIRHIKPPTKAIWTGIYSRTDTTHTWISVEDGSAVPYTQWNAQQPTTSPAKRCVQMLAHSVSGGGKWENTFCDIQLPAVCQRQKAWPQPSMLPPTTRPPEKKPIRQHASGVCEIKKHYTISDCTSQGLVGIPLYLNTATQYLYLQHNNISWFPPKNLKRVMTTRHLERLDLSYNNLEVLEEHQFGYRNHIRLILRLSHNNMRFFHPKAFRSLTRHARFFKELYLDHNKL
eukprot:scpid92158/ scgid17351/ 